MSNGRTIQVDPPKMVESAVKIEGLAGEYKKDYQRLLSEVEGMSKNWNSKDNLAFTTQVKGFEVRFQAMFDLLNEYAGFLRKSAADYGAGQEAIAAAAKRLVN